LPFITATVPPSIALPTPSWAPPSTRIETRGYVKRRVRKSEKRIRRTVRDLEARSERLEQRIDQVEADREAAEWRVHSDIEAMLDGLLEDVRAIADRLAGHPAPTR
jgi:hypothetical protein